MFNTIGQRDYRAGMRDLVQTQATTLINNAAKDDSPASSKAALKLVSEWDKAHPGSLVTVSLKVYGAN